MIEATKTGNREIEITSNTDPCNNDLHREQVQTALCQAGEGEEDKTMEILPGKGWGQIKFGMRQNAVNQILGAPDEIENDKEDELAYHHYDELTLSLTYDGTEDDRLSTIIIADGASTLFGEDLFTLSLDEIKTLLKAQGCKGLSVEGEDEDKVLEAEELEMIFWFENDELMEVQWGPFFADEDQILWPA